MLSVYSFLKSVKNKRGESLIQVLVTVGIMMISIAVMMSMQSNQTKENKALSEKLAALDFTRFATSTLASSSTCNALLTATNVVGGASSLTFDATSVSTAHPNVIDLLQIGGVSAGGAVSPTSVSLVIRAVKGIQLSITSPTTADLLVNFDQDKLVRPLRNLSFPVTLQSVGVISSTTIKGCFGGSDDGVPVGYGIMPKWDGNWTGNHFTCPPGYTLASQHYDCHCSNNATWLICIKN